LKRGEALTLLKELESTFDTLKSTKWVLLKNDEREGLWELHIEWIPQPSEELFLLDLSKKHNLEISVMDGQTKFRRSK
jgi:hypothetical protein